MPIGKSINVVFHQEKSILCDGIFFTQPNFNKL
jgi:hypothetical protein